MHIGEVDDLLAIDKATEKTIRSAAGVGQCQGLSVRCCGQVKGFAVISAQRAVRGLAEPQGLFHYRLKHRSEAAGRGIDDL